MAMVPNPTQVLQLYRLLMRYSSKFTNYNFRAHAMRRSKMGFVMNRHVEGVELAEKFAFGMKQLEIAKRQSLVSQLYPDTMTSVMQKSVSMRMSSN
mmetsp:Transcript_29172/g.27956  ORF Transcript_29172/g.27956 Transcript_29172/m.27956 type:complete len:96 (+) Transcript_29172:118-405(+)